MDAVGAVGPLEVVVSVVAAEENRSLSVMVQLLAAISFGLRVYYLRPGRQRHNAAPNLSPFSCVVFLENKILPVSLLCYTYQCKWLFVVDVTFWLKFNVFLVEIFVFKRLFMKTRSSKTEIRDNVES